MNGKLQLVNCRGRPLRTSTMEGSPKCGQRRKGLSQMWASLLSFISQIIVNLWFLIEIWSFQWNCYHWVNTQKSIDGRLEMKLHFIVINGARSTQNLLSHAGQASQAGKNTITYSCPLAPTRVSVISSTYATMTQVLCQMRNCSSTDK